MKMHKGSTIPLQVVLFLLMLLGSTSSFSFSAYTDIPEAEISKDNQEDLCISIIGEQVQQLYDSVLPVQKNILFLKGDLGTVWELKSHLLYHTNSSEGYIKRSRNIFPALGVKEVIFPFHVFL